MLTPSFRQHEDPYRRGPVRELLSDPGANFVGAQNELKKVVEEMDKGRFREELLKENIDWVMNPAKASNYGGVWERQIRSVRSIMTALLEEHGRKLNDESLHTFMCEAEAIINSRLLTVDTISDPLSPLLYLVKKVVKRALIYPSIGFCVTVVRFQGPPL